MVLESNSGHQLLSPPAVWCPTFASRTTQVEAPQLWTAETPYLYTLLLTLAVQGHPGDPVKVCRSSSLSTSCSSYISTNLREQNLAKHEHTNVTVKHENSVFCLPGVKYSVETLCKGSR